MTRIGIGLKEWGLLPKKKRICFLLFNAVFPLLIGFVFYLLFVPSAFVTKLVCVLLNVDVLQTGIDLSGTFLTSYFADWLWAYALFIIVSAFLLTKPKDIFITMTICVLFEALIETAQLTGWIDGTFDVIDVIVETQANVTAFVVLLFFSDRIIRRNKNTQEK